MNETVYLFATYRTLVMIVGNLPELKRLSKSLGGQHVALLEVAKKYKTNVLELKLGDEYVVTALLYPTVKEILQRQEFEGQFDIFVLRLCCLGKKRDMNKYIH
jgi:hypothetical protein